ncbi:MAG: uncharacterized protein QOK29_3084 [Rhodospirillaceae bacterium]|jgi:predicted DNA-binding protein with PD1-like motif|nr:uncharacterized protein [Rhodospirillaceae bacterium]
MRAKLLNADPPVTYAVALGIGEEVVEKLGDFVREEEIDAGSITGIGGFQRAVVGFFEWETKEYKRIQVDEQVEVLSFLGDVAVTEGVPTLHVHAVLGRSDGSVIGGHLLEAHVRPTLEVILIQPPSYLRRRRDPETGLALISTEPP